MKSFYRTELGFRKEKRLIICLVTYRVKDQLD